MADQTNPSTADDVQNPSSGALTVPGTPVVLASSSLYEDDRALDVLAYLRTLTRWRVPALIVAALVLVAGMAYAFTRPATYTGEATVLLVPEKVTSDAEATQQAAMLPFVTKSYAYMVDSPLVLQRVVDKLGDPTQKVANIKAGLSTGYPANSLILRIQYTDSTSQKATQLTNLIANEYVAAVPTFSPGADQNVSLGAKVIAPAQDPLDPDPSVKLQYAALSLAAAIALGFGVAIVLDVVSRLRKPKA